MNKKSKRATAIAIFLFLLVALEVVYIFSELYTDNNKPGDSVVTDALKFKEEYEILNGTKNSNGQSIRAITIADDNPFIYSTPEEIVERIDNNESFVVYFGFSSCPWCRSILEPLIYSAKENNITKIYYVDVLNIRDVYELNDKKKAVKTVEGTDAYFELLKRLDDVLDDYTPLTYIEKGKTKTVKVNEKRIYAPNIITVKNGKAMSNETGIIKSLNDSYMKITDEMFCEIKERFKCLFDTLKDNESTCELGAQKC